MIRDFEALRILLVIGVCVGLKCQDLPYVRRSLSNMYGAPSNVAPSTPSMRPTALTETIIADTLSTQC